LLPKGGGGGGGGVECCPPVSSVWTLNEVSPALFTSSAVHDDNAANARQNKAEKRYFFMILYLKIGHRFGYSVFESEVWPVLSGIEKCVHCNEGKLCVL